MQKSVIHTGITADTLREIRKDFPILSSKAYGRPLVYLDNAATTQKPLRVIDSIRDYYLHSNANIHRAVHYLGQEASRMYDDVRVQVKDFIHANSENEIVFVRGTTEAINLVAASYGRTHVGAGDEIIISAMEHHSNIVPWQLLCDERKALLRIIPMDDNGELDVEEYKRLLSSRTRLVSIVHTSNSLGTINPVKEIIEEAHRFGVPVLVDAAQAIIHEEIDVTALGCDFLAFSGHKMLGPTGIGVLYGRSELLDGMPPYQGGGEMIRSVSFEKTTYNDPPFRFEAGTPDIAGVVGLGAAIQYLNGLDREAAHIHEQALIEKVIEGLRKIEGIRIIGMAHKRTCVVSFIIEGVNALDAGMYMDTLGIAVRTGHHCTEPVMTRFGIPGTIRASFLFYNTPEEADIFLEGVRKAVQFFKKKA